MCSAGPLLALFGSALLALACSLPVMADENGELKLSLETADSQPGRPLPLDHPAKLDPSELQTLLGQLIGGESGLLGRSSQRSVFRPEETGQIAAAVAEVLARATPQQQLRFAWFSQPGGSLGQLRKTEAVVFRDREGRLNLAFTTIHDFAGPDRDFFEFMALSRQDPLAVTRSLVRLTGLPDGVEAVPTSGRRAHPLWVRTTSSALPSAWPAGESPPPRTPALPVADPAPAAVLAPSSPSPAEAAVPEAGNETQQAVRARLEFLKELYDSGLITEAEYTERRREALDRLDP